MGGLTEELLEAPAPYSSQELNVFLIESKKEVC